MAKWWTDEAAANRMETILKEFRLGMLLRSTFSGAFLLIAYRVAWHDLGGLSKTTIDDLKIAPPLAMLFGMIVYSIHRSCLHPLLEWGLDCECAKRTRRICPLVSDNTIKKRLWRWNFPSTPEDRKGINEHFNTWGDYIHLQYNSLWCMAVGASAGKFMNSNVETCGPMVGIGFVLFASAFISDWRQHSFIDFLERDCTEKPKSNLDSPPPEIRNN